MLALSRKKANLAGQCTVKELSLHRWRPPPDQSDLHRLRELKPPLFGAGPVSELRPAQRPGTPSTSPLPSATRCRLRPAATHRTWATGVLTVTAAAVATVSQRATTAGASARSRSKRSVSGPSPRGMRYPVVAGSPRRSRRRSTPLTERRTLSPATEVPDGRQIPIHRSTSILGQAAKDSARSRPRWRWSSMRRSTTGSACTPLHSATSRPIAAIRHDPTRFLWSTSCPTAGCPVGHADPRS